MKVKFLLSTAMALAVFTLAGCSVDSSSRSDNYFGYSNSTERAPDPVDNSAQDDYTTYDNYNNSNVRAGADLVNTDNFTRTDYHGGSGYYNDYDPFYGTRTVRYDVFYHSYSPYYSNCGYDPFFVEPGFGIYFSFGTPYYYPHYPRVVRYSYAYYPYDYWYWNHPHYPGWYYYPGGTYTPVIYANSTPSTPKTYRRIGVTRGNYGNVNNSSGNTDYSRGQRGSNLIPVTTQTSVPSGLTGNSDAYSRGRRSSNPSSNDNVNRSNRSYTPSNNDNPAPQRNSGNSNSGQSNTYRRGSERSTSPSSSPTYTPRREESPRSTPQSGGESYRRGGNSGGENRGNSSGGSSSGGSENNSRRRTR